MHRKQIVDSFQRELPASPEALGGGLTHPAEGISASQKADGGQCPQNSLRSSRARGAEMQLEGIQAQLGFKDTSNSIQILICKALSKQLKLLYIKTNKCLEIETSLLTYILYKRGVRL